MSKSDDVRFSRDGDQFHYLWAARRCLKLLAPTTTLVAITIEGPSPKETPDGEGIISGDEVIDVGEYYGSTSIEDATCVRYVQLKHSTVKTADAWTMSGLKVTLEGFAKRYQEFVIKLGAITVAEKFEFIFTTNRPINVEVKNAIEDAREGYEPRNALASRGLEKYSGLAGSDLASFCALLSIESEQDGFLAQRKALESDLQGYLPDGDSEAFLAIKELVTRKATSEYLNNPSITKLDILRVLGTDVDYLFPAQNQISLPNLIIPRANEITLVEAIIGAGGSPVIVHAEGGVGKSVFASRIGSHLPPGSIAVVYDCFGNGEYRAPSHPRHSPRQALVQIANELASGTYCRPIIPSGRAEDTAYFRAFSARIAQAVNSIQQAEKHALLCIIIDAADNAEMAATESGEKTSFARRLIREPFPEGVRLVMLCRTHRRHLLNLPPSTIELSLSPFSWDETAAKLRGVFPHASNQDVHEFHRLSSQNPRVQTTALEQPGGLHDILRNLGPEPKTVDDMIGQLLKQAVERAKDEVPTELHQKFDRICTALAVLRPLIPLSVLASLAHLEKDNLRSFLADFGQSVLIKGDLLQFRDEPTETWFQEHFNPNKNAFNEFIEVLRPQARLSPYVAATLPHLLLKAGQMDELIKIALNSSDLPVSNTLEKRDIEAQRLHFALRASLRVHRYLDATKLALAAASIAATEGRQWKTLQANTDLAGMFLEQEQVLSVVTRKEFSAGWKGSHHVYDASILSFTPEFHGDAQSHIRMAEEWLRNMQKLPVSQRKNERLDASDLVELVVANLNIYGPEKAAITIRRCTKRQFRYDVASLVARRLTDGARLAELDAISIAAAHDTVLVAALAVEAARVGHLLPKVGIKKAWTNVARLNPQESVRHNDMEAHVPSLLTAFAWTVLKLKICTSEATASVLTRHLGTDRLRSLGYLHDRSGPSLVKAYLLKNTLSGNVSTLINLAHPDWHEALTKGGAQPNQREIREFRTKVGALIPWYQLWADVVCRQVPDEEVSARLLLAEKTSCDVMRLNYRNSHQLKNDIALAHMEILLALTPRDESHIDSLRERLLNNAYFSNTRIEIVSIAARIPSFTSFALEVASQVAVQLDAVHEQAESRADSWVALARALMSCHKGESKHFFKKSIEVAAKLGDENLSRWSAVLHLADAASSSVHPEPQLAYRVARSAELTYDFVFRDKHFDWQGTVEAISNLCPSSAFAILSRWRDRNFGSCQRLLAKLVEHLAPKKILDPALTTALYGFQAMWNPSNIYSLVIENSCGQIERQQRSDFLFQYIQLDEQNESTWEEIQKKATEFNLILPNIEIYINYAKYRRKISEDTKTKNNDSSHLHEPVDWTCVFAGLTIASLSSLTEANRRYISVRTYDRSTNFFEQAMLRVPLGQEAEFLQSLQNFPKFDLYDLTHFLQELPVAWRKQFSTMSEVQSLVKILVARHSLEISMFRYHQALPLEMVERETNLPTTDLIIVALEATAETAFQLGSERLFGLVGLLAKLLSKHEATEALNFELIRLESSMEESLGDGHWTDALLPPTDINSSIAGYVWAALAAPEAEYRWQATHVVRAMCQLGCGTCIDFLMLWLKTTPPPQFMERNLIHYRLHANLWLLIGLARAALDYPNVLKKHIQSFVELTAGGEPHVLIRSFSAQAAIAIGSSNPAELSAEVLAQLRSINVPIFNPDATSRKRRLENHRRKRDSAEKFKLHFGIDMPAYWFDPLATCFGLSTDEICASIQEVIVNRWGISSIQWDDDQRYQREYYSHDATRHSHGSYPKSEDLNFYLCFHSMMTVAGQLLATVPMTVPQDEVRDYETFQYWLHRFELTRPDGRWLADRRDPEPPDYLDWLSESDNKTWSWSVTKDDFSKILFSEAGMVAVSGNWFKTNGTRNQQVSIGSALVSTESAHALLIASQTASNLNWSAPLPRAGDEDVSIAGFELTGWVLGTDRNYGIDQQDPWYADIHFPPLVPSELTYQLLGLLADEDKRHWYHGDDKKIALKSLTWGTPPSDDRTDESNHGLRLEASLNTLKELISKTGKSLIFKVSISRKLSSYHQKDEDLSVKYPAPYILYFLLGKDGKFISL